MSEQFAAEEGILVSEGGRDLDDQHRSFWVDRNAAIEAMYSDCIPEDAEWAWSRLRPQARSAQDERCPLDRLPQVPSSYIVCRHDRMTSPAWGARGSRERLGVESIEIPGGHTPQLSRPVALARTLIGLA